MRRSSRLALIASLAASAAAVALAVPASAASTPKSVATRVGSTLDVYHGVAFNTRTSGNWFGYVQGTLEKKGNPVFKQIAGSWTVPTATQHKAGEAENSSSWIGIGGGCVNANCLITDTSETLIQAGTEQDVAANGAASYYAWYELLPAPSLRTTLVVHPGDKIHCTINEPIPGLWGITLKNLTTGKTWHTNVPYTSTHLTAEWVNETPLTVTGFAALPNLTRTHFDDAKVNNVNANLVPAERIYITNGSGAIYGAASVPQGDKNGFGICSWATTCTVPPNF